MGLLTLATVGFFVKLQLEDFYEKVKGKKK